MLTTSRMGLSLVLLLAITPIANAQSISNGAYASQYPDNLRIEIKGSQYKIVSIDFADEGWRNRSETKFKYIKRGVFYSLVNKKYYCSVGMLTTKQQQSGAFDCSKKGWKAFK
jgi:hypothetical protein